MRAITKLSGVQSIPYKAAQQLPPKGSFDGIVLATILNERQSVAFGSLVKVWSPKDILIALPGQLPQQEALRWLPTLGIRYSKRLSRPRHADMGGATATSWHLAHLTTREHPLVLRDVMTVGHYQQTLQASLDDTIPGRHGN